MIPKMVVMSATFIPEATIWSLHFPLFSCDWTGGLSWKSGRSSRKYVLCSCLFSLVWRDDLPLLSRKNKRSWIYLYSWLRDRILLSLFTSRRRCLYSSLDRRKFCGNGRLKWSFSLEFTKCLVFCHFCLCDNRAHSYDVVLSSQLPHVFTGSW